ncbi:YicC family protein [Comamonas serinivorans]|uniref:YicC family protein n=1 Tax=Comamonas serinivorans TaxID=1082851 RepID=A0A1Y0EN81_9BURK|nr:YicC/YloC family endoribonuclease [Comamonas serinivorans]ARU05103.1 YicC family protein [Comamonas serinivorans]
MAVYSMTGYANVQKSTASGTESSAVNAQQIGLELRSVNSRFLDISFRLPDSARHLEALFRDALTRSLRRGKVELRLTVNRSRQDGPEDPSAAHMHRLAALQNHVRNWMPDAKPLSVADVLRLCSADDSAEVSIEADDATALVQDAIAQLKKARASEGERLKSILLAQVGQLRELGLRAQPLIPKLVEQQRERFLQRWNEALKVGNGAPLPEAANDRALAEATAYAIRIDVAEELNRLQSHLTEIEQLLGKGGEMGKRLDFLIQELHREANTLGSKSAALELTQISVDMKVLIEQLREQVQNLE